MSLPFMRFYPQDYLQDTNHLTTEEHGAYLLLIINYWQTEKPLIDDNKRLAGICRTSVEHWLNVRSTLVELFNVDNGLWSHKRIESELCRIKRVKKQASDAGKISASLRQGKIKEIQRSLNDTDTDTDTDTDSDSNKPSVPTVPVKTCGCPVSKIVELYHQTLPNLPRCRKLTQARRAIIKQRHHEDMEKDLSTWESYFKLIGRSSFLMGNEPPGYGRDKPFIATLDWICKAENYAKIYEGKYNGKV